MLEYVEGVFVVGDGVFEFDCDYWCVCVVCDF